MMNKLTSCIIQFYINTADVHIKLCMGCMIFYVLILPFIGELVNSLILFDLYILFLNITILY